jgi:hypothetical protein
MVVDSPEGIHRVEHIVGDKEAEIGQKIAVEFNDSFVMDLELSHMGLVVAKEKGNCFDCIKMNKLILRLTICILFMNLLI